MTVDADSDDDGDGSLITSTGAGGSWVQRGIDIDGEATEDNSGYSVRRVLTAMLAVGARGNDGSGTDSGQARVYDWISSAWVQRGADIDGEMVGDLSGRSVAFSSDGNMLVVGAYRNDGNGTDSGQTRVYDWSGSEWVQRGLDINGQAEFNFFGVSVAVSDDGDTLVVGATLNDNAGEDAGQCDLMIGAARRGCSVAWPSTEKPPLINSGMWRSVAMVTRWQWEHPKTTVMVVGGPARPEFTTGTVLHGRSAPTSTVNRLGMNLAYRWR